MVSNFPVVPDRPLRFYKLSPRCIDVLEGDPFVLVCRAEGDPRPSIIWYKDKVAIRRNDVNVTEAKQSNGGDYQYEV